MVPLFILWRSQWQKWQWIGFICINIYRNIYICISSRFYCQISFCLEDISFWLFKSYVTWFLCWYRGIKEECKFAVNSLYIKLSKKFYMKGCICLMNSMLGYFLISHLIISQEPCDIWLSDFNAILKYFHTHRKMINWNGCFVVHRV